MCVKSNVNVLTRTRVKWNKTWGGGFDALEEALKSFNEGSNLPRGFSVSCNGLKKVTNNTTHL
jgi:hypothetical protein